jgi:hypothetical protein
LEDLAMSDKIEQTYSFSYTDIEGKVHEKTIKTQGMTWMECMNDYVRFLESVFQYSIMDSVRIKEPQWLSSMYEAYPDYLDVWTGEYFVDGENNENLSSTGLSD